MLVLFSERDCRKQEGEVIDKIAAIRHRLLMLKIVLYG